MTALRLAETSLFSRVVLTDVVPGLAAGLAPDMWHSAALRGFTTRIEGGEDPSALAGADYIVVTAGRPRQPGMSRTDLTGVNAAIIETVGEGIRQSAPNAVVVVVANPLEEMTHLMARTTGFPAERVIGMAGVLESARSLARRAHRRRAAAGCLGDCARQPWTGDGYSRSAKRWQTARRSRVCCQQPRSTPLSSARDSGAEVVKLLQKGSAYFSPAESAAAMVVDMARDSGRRSPLACSRAGPMASKTRVSACRSGSAGAGSRRSSRFRLGRPNKRRWRTRPRGAQRGGTKA